MSPRNRAVVACVIAVCCFVAFAAAATAAGVYRAGWVVVDVREGPPDGSRLSLRVPGAAVEAVAGLFGGVVCGQVPAELRGQWPALRAAALELHDKGDFVLVEVDGPEERVRISSRDEALVVEVRSGEEEVRVAVPLRAVAGAVGMIEARCRTHATRG